MNPIQCRGGYNDLQKNSELTSRYLQQALEWGTLPDIRMVGDLCPDSLLRVEPFYCPHHPLTVPASHHVEARNLT